MTPPPPSDPIRPIGPVSGGIYVGRAEHPWRVGRRTRQDGDDEEQRGHGHAHGEPRRDEQPREEAEDLAARAGTYDDHGRTHARDDDETPPRRHVDASA